MIYHLKRGVRGWAVMAVLVGTLVWAGNSNTRIGHGLQVTLPAAAFICSAIDKKLGSLVLRFTGMEAVLQGSKYGLGSAPINIRPNGKDRGFPSGHTATAAFGASSLINSCLLKNPIVASTVLLSAGYVGGSRIESNAHTLLQVLFGALLGWLSERFFVALRLGKAAVIGTSNFLKNRNSTPSPKLR